MESIVWRPQWLSPFAALAYTIGLGNVWRFPYYCHTHGGFVFLVPYCCVLLLVVYPLLLLQIMVGQYCCRGSVAIYRNVAPIAAGLGWSLLLVETILVVYYNVQVSWILYYVAGAVMGLPWTDCQNQFNSEDCISLEMLDNVTNGLSINTTHHSNAAEEYFYYGLLGGEKSDDWKGLGSMQLRVVLCLLLCWTLVFCMLSNDVYVSKNVICSTVGLPWLLLFLLATHVLVHRCEHIDGQVSTVDWSHVYSPESYIAATVHAFHSYGLTLSGVTSIASHNTILRNVSWDAAIIVVLDTMTAVMSYVVVSYTFECIDDPHNVLSNDHMLLAFVVYPMAVARISYSMFWAPVFFITFFIIGISSQAMMVLSITINLKDRWPSLWPRQFAVLGVTCGLLMLLGLPLCTQGGADLVHFLASVTGGPATVLICLLAACFLAHGCGFTLLRSILTDKFQLRVPRLFSCYLKFTWLYITPVLILVCVVLSVYYAWHRTSVQAVAVRWEWHGLFNIALISPVIICAVYRYYRHQGPFRDLFRPTAEFSTIGGRGRFVSTPPPLADFPSDVITNGNGGMQRCSIVSLNMASGASNGGRETSNTN